MKNFRVSVLALMLLVSAASFANGPEKKFGKKGVKVYEVEKSLIDINLDPVFKRKGDKLLLNILNLDKNVVVIKVLDSEGRLVYTERVKDKAVIEKAFNFEDAYEDKYTVIVVDNKEIFKEVVEVK